jgi:DNA repair protein RadA/Sms
VNRIEQRISEAEKLGFERIIISKYNRKATEGWQGNIEVIPVATVEDVYRLLFP